MKPRPSVPAQSILLPLFVIFLLICLSFTACGGGGGGSSSGGGGTPPPTGTPDFSLNVQPSSISLAANSSATVDISITPIRGFNSAVEVALSQMLPGITLTPSTFTISPGEKRTVTIHSDAALASGSLRFTASSAAGNNRYAELAVTLTGTPDFSVQLAPASVVISPNSSTSVRISVGSVFGFNTPVNILLSGLPTGVSASPSSVVVTPGTSQDVRFTGGSNVQPGTVALSVQATAGGVQHNQSLSLTIVSAASAMHPPTRVRYLRTDANLAERHLLYHAPTNRFFLTNMSLHRIDVFDAVAELQVGQVSIPGALSLDSTPDGSVIWVGTQIGDLYQVDPVTMTVKKRIPASEIGPLGYPSYYVRVLADGRLALTGNQGGIPSVDGYGSFAIWDPITNSLSVNGDGMFESGYIGGFDLTPDRTKIVMSNLISDGLITVFDPNTGTKRFMTMGDFVDQVLISKDGKELIVPMGNSSSTDVLTYDIDTFSVKSSFKISEGSSWYRLLLSRDGNTLYASDRFSNYILAYDSKTHALKGWLANFSIDDLEDRVVPLTMDDTGLLAGTIGRGIGFLDASNVIPGSPLQSSAFATLNPAFGPPEGGTSTTIGGTILGSGASSVYLGMNLATDLGTSYSDLTLKTPAGTGYVDVAVFARDGRFNFIPEGFSYGPSVIQVTADATTAEGGGTSTIFGYGFGPEYGTAMPADLQVTVGGQPATISKYSGTPPDNAWFPFPQQYIQITLPPGTAGTTADVVVTNSAGTVKAKDAIRYLPAVKQFSSPGSVLVQGVYDPRRDVYYFTDKTSILVFSRSLQKWLAPIPIPNAVRLFGIALSADGSKLVASDIGANNIYLLNPDTPGTVTALSAAIQFDPDASPAAVAVRNDGIVYFVVFRRNTYGGTLVHRLDTATGNITVVRDFSSGAAAYDAYTRIQLSKDDVRLFLNVEGTPFAFDTQTGRSYNNPVVWGGDYEMAVSNNGTWMAAAEYLMDTNLNPSSYVSLNDREASLVSAVYGQKLSPDGSLLFQPLEHGIDVMDGHLGSLLTRVAMPINLSADYDALVANGRDNVLVAIIKDGIAVIDLTSIPEPNPSVAGMDLLPMAAATAKGELVGRIRTRSTGNARTKTTAAGSDVPNPNPARKRRHVLGNVVEDEGKMN